MLTAAHCLFNGNLLVNSGNVRFLAGSDKGVPAAHSDAKRLIVPKEFSPGPPTQESVANDWAVIVLSDAISTKPIEVKSITAQDLARSSILPLLCKSDTEEIASIFLPSFEIVL